eukprot:355474-Chlamydomonas_euryale.AAC.3
MQHKHTQSTLPPDPRCRHPHLELADGLAKLLALGRVWKRDVHRRLHQAHRPSSKHQALVVEAALRMCGRAAGCGAWQGVKCGNVWQDCAVAGLRSWQTAQQQDCAATGLRCNRAAPR